MSPYMQPYTFVALRLPSGTHKVVKLIPDTSTITLGKYGSFNSNLLLGRPYNLTFEILDKAVDRPYAELRVVPAAELHAEALLDSEISPSESRDEGVVNGGDGVQFDIFGEDGELIMRNNRLTVDDPSRQALTMEEIEELKKAASGSGKDIINKIMNSHSALDEKTAFSFAKYALRKGKKYLRRFTVLPMDVGILTHWMLHEKEPARIMELREETLGLILSWANIHCGISSTQVSSSDGVDSVPSGRWLVIDDTSGLVVAAMAEKMGLLYPESHSLYNGGIDGGQDHESGVYDNEQTSQGLQEIEGKYSEQVPSSGPNGSTRIMHSIDTIQSHPRRKPRRHPPNAMSATSNTITVLHPATQPNLSILSYFSFDPTESSQAGLVPASDHPLHIHLKTLSWLQLLSPHLDSAYAEPERVPDDVLATWKPGKRGSYYRKRRRWERIKRVVDETRAGSFDGLVVASPTSADSILHHTVPLLRGGAQIVVYSPNVEPLEELVDAYSSARKTAFMTGLSNGTVDEAALPNEDFPVDPRLLLAPNLQTVRANEWQVLPGRTHPLMTGRGGAEGYVFTATRVLPVEGKVEARGRFTKKRKTIADEGPGQTGFAEQKHSSEPVMNGMA